MTDGFNRGSFSNFRADCKRATRQMLHTCKLASDNGVGDQALASACLNTAAELMTKAGGREVAVESLRLAMDRIASGEFDGTDARADSRYLN
jgi:hypothetical protein